MYKIGHQIKNQPIEGLQVRKPIESERPEFLSITLEKGGVLPEHTSPSDAILIVLEGRLDFLIDGETYCLEKFQDFSFPKDVTHRVEAREDSRFLIIR